MLAPISALFPSSCSKNGIPCVITSLASYARVNDYGFIMTPYRKVEKKHLTDEIVYMTADEELEHYISQATVKIDEDLITKFYNWNLMITCTSITSFKSV